MSNAEYVRHTIEARSSPVCMGIQRRIVSIDGHQVPWVCGKMADVWKAYKQMRKQMNHRLIDWIRNE